MPRYQISGGGVPAILSKVLRIVTTSIQAFWVGPTNALSTFLVNTTNKRVGINVGTGAPDAKLSIANDEGGAGTDPEFDVYYQGTADAGIATKYFDLFGHQTAGVMDGGTIRMFNKTIQTVQISGTTTLPSFLMAGKLGLGVMAPTYFLEVAPLANCPPNLTALFCDATLVTGKTRFVIKDGPGQAGADTFVIQNTAGTGRFTVNATSGSLGIAGALSASGIVDGSLGSFDLSSNSVGLGLGSLRLVRWASTNAYNGTYDAGVGRNAPGIVEVNNGTLGTLRDLLVRNLGIAGVADNVKSGTYTPVASAAANLDATPIMKVCQWMRVGDVVTVSGQFDANATAAGVTSFEMTLPIASNFANENELGGTANTYFGMAAALSANVANNTVDVYWTNNGTDLALNGWFFQFTYRII